MPRAIPAALLAAKNRLWDSAAWIWLFDVGVDQGTAVLRLARNPENITITGGPDDGLVYHAFPIDFEQLEENTEGDLVSARLTVSNVTREIMAVIEHHHALTGELVHIHLFHSENPGIRMDWGEYEISEVTTNADSAVFSLSTSSFEDTNFPSRRYLPRCGADYRDENCGWPQSVFIPLGVTDIPTCDKSLDGPNGCAVHGAAYAAAGVAPLHPARFVGFVSIPKRRGP